MRKLLALLLALALVLSLSACLAEKPVVVEEKIAMITAYGAATDTEISQPAWEAVEKFAASYKTEARCYHPQTFDTVGRNAAIEQAIAEGYSVLVLPGYAFGGSIAELSGKYPEVKFIALDVNEGDLLEGGVPLKGESYDYNPDNWELTDYVYMDNVYCANFKEEVAGFMAGYAAVKLGYTKLGFCGGIAVPTLIRYVFGFMQGADVAAQEMDVSVDMNYVYTNMCYHGDETLELMEQWYADGTEAVFTCAIGADEVIQAARKCGGKVILADTEPYEKAEDALVIARAYKNYAACTEYALTELLVKKNGERLLGTIERLGLEEDYDHVGFVGNTQFAEGKFTLADYEALIQKLETGELTVSGNIDTEPVTTNVTVEHFHSVQ